MQLPFKRRKWEPKIAIAQSEAARREKEAEALRIALASEKVQQAKH